MGYDVALIASITLPEDAVARWKKHLVSVEAYDDWPDVLTSPDADPLDKTAPSVGALLKALPERAHLACGVREEGGNIKVAAVFADDPFCLFSPWIAAALRDAAAFGGRGRVDFIGFLTSQVAFSFDVKPGKSALRELEEAEVWKIDKTPQILWLEHTVDGAREPLPAFKWPKKIPPSKKPTPPPMPGAEAGFGVLLSGELRFPTQIDANGWVNTKVSLEEIGRAHV